LDVCVLQNADIAVPEREPELRFYSRTVSSRALARTP
jgi:hypothetical protein